MNQYDNPWTEEELITLRNHYCALGAKKIAELIGRPFWGVARKASRLGLKSGPREIVEDVRKVSLLTDTESAYLAGIFDGEGTISIKEYSGRGAVAYLTISTTDEDLHIWLQNKIGGYVSSTRNDHPIWRKVYQWHSERPAHVLAILSAIAPYAVTKVKHIEIVSRSCVLRLARPRKSNATNEERQLLEQIRPLQMKRRN